MIVLLSICVGLIFGTFLQGFLLSMDFKEKYPLLNPFNDFVAVISVVSLSILLIIYVYGIIKGKNSITRFFMDLLCSLGGCIPIIILYFIFINVVSYVKKVLGFFIR